ncbi:MAG: DUF2378 family protein [Myxococcaceae bacterium]
MTAQGAASSEKLVYKPVFEALRQGLVDVMTPGFREALKGMGLNFEKLDPGYPYPLFEKVVLEAAKLFTDRSQPDAVAEVGRRLALATVDQNPVGKHLLPLLRVMSTGKALRRVYSRSTGENYNEVSFGAETPKSLEMNMTDVGNIPDMARGSIFGMGDAIGLKLRAKIIWFEAPKVRYLIEWD